MLSARTLLQQIHRDDEAFRLFCSIAAKGESQGGWENHRIAARVADPVLAPKIARHGADEDKHGRIFAAMLRRRGLEPVEVPPETDYCMLLERRGIGLAHELLRRDEPMTTDAVVVYLAHSRITEQRAAEDMSLLRSALGEHPDVGRGIRMICDDEENHLAYCHEELLRLVREGHGPRVREVLHDTAHAEAEVNRDVTVAVTEHMGEILRWPRHRARVLAAGAHAMYTWDRTGGRRRMVRLRPPQRRNPLGASTDGVHQPVRPVVR